MRDPIQETAPRDSRQVIQDSNREASRIIALLKRDFLLPDGAFCIERENGAQRPFTIFADLGDTLPFLDYFREQDFADRQVTLYERSLQHGYMVSQFPTLGVPHLVKSYEYTDLILGLLWYADNRKGNPHAWQILMQAVVAARNVFRIGGKLRSFYHPRFHIRLPIVDTRDSMFIESWVTLWQMTHEERYLREARQVFRQLVGATFFKRYGLFADYEPTSFFSALILRTNRKCRQSSICKNTSSALFAFVELYRVQPEPEVLGALRHLIEGLRANAIRGGVIERFSPEEKDVHISLVASFSVLDGLCDCAHFIPDIAPTCIELACGIADFWMDLQGETGLFSLRAGGNESFIDAETDMSVALSKLAEITGESRYRVAAERCIDGVIRFHGAADYCLGVDIRSGDVINPGQRTKFICLFLKALILRIENATGSTIYGNLRLYELLKDR